MGQTPQTPAPNAEMIQPHSRPASSVTPGSGATSSTSTGKPKMVCFVLFIYYNVSAEMS